STGRGLELGTWDLFGVGSLVFGVSIQGFIWRLGFGVSFSLLVELAFEERIQFVEGPGGVFSLSLNREFAPRPGSQHHQAHDALAVDLLAVLLDEDIAAEAVGRF